ncbi:leucine-rich repeat-containing protein 27-like [Solea solea]|uniref:leucine-rich repeat-containing protein 27-like n=1 Tax=Solea solea TaxID=90069 RepID=UPI00272A75C0|nr:leucine-rich repeat-containing protein 27-like [Solea solea]
MSSSPDRETEGDVSDLQLNSSVFHISVVKPQTPHVLPEDAEPQEPAAWSSTQTLCLSRTKLQSVSDSILKNGSLKYLYLEGNQISSIPDSLFTRLPNLQWLDLRNNLIPSLSAGIGLHRSLKTLLLGGNPISELPPEMGHVITLKGLNLRNCPITFPPQDIVDQGVQGILQYLRSAMAKRQVIMKKAPPVELPVVEKLQLAGLMEFSVEEQDDDELQKFKELKHKMILLDKAELGSVGQSDRTPKSRICPVGKGVKATTKVGMVPELPLFDSQHWKRPEERRQAATKEMKERQAILEQRIKSQAALSKWRTQAKIAQEKKNEKQKRHEEANVKPDVMGCSDTQQRQTSTTDWEKTRSGRDLERQICVRVEKIQERRLNPRGTASEQMAAAAQDVEEMTKLQRQLLENRNPGRNLDKCFTIFTGDNWKSFLDK